MIKDMLGIDLTNTSSSDLERLLRKAVSTDKSSSPIFPDIPSKPPTTPRDSISTKTKTVTWDTSQVKKSEDLDFIHDAYQ